jgi:hypothetical protein
LHQSPLLGSYRLGQPCAGGSKYSDAKPISDTSQGQRSDSGGEQGSLAHMNFLCTRRECNDSRFRPVPYVTNRFLFAVEHALANRGHDTRALQDYLGHKDIQHTVRYTELSSTRFKNFWRE